MAKKIIINFLDIPVTTGAGWLYTIDVNGQSLYYNSGSVQCLIDFIPNGDTPASINEIAVGTTLAETLDITLNHLRTNFVNSSIIYDLVGDTIDVTINANAVININNAYLNANISFTQEDIDVAMPGLKYYINFEDYYLSITQKGYLGFSTEIFGQIQINKGSVDTILEPIRGTGLNLALEANSALTFDEFGLADEMTYFVQLKKGNKILFNGFIKPDGIQQSWVNQEWLVNIEVIDGLGAMKDLSFVKSDGYPFTGKISLFDVIKGCLDRTGTLMTINTSVNIIYDGYAGANVLKDVYVNASRYVKKDGETIMNCNEVLESILNIFSAVITQEDGQWWIYRPNDLVSNQYTTFINNTTDATFTKNLSASLGSQIDNFYPHHCDSNQQIEMKGAISAYRLRYEYGFLDGFLKNKELVHDTNMYFEDWTLNGKNGSLIINDPNDLTGVKIFSTAGNVFLEVITSYPFAVTAGAVLNVKANLFTSSSYHFFRFRLKRSDGKYCDKDGIWTTNPNSYFEGKCGGLGSGAATADFTFVTEEVTADCTVTLTILKPVWAFTGSIDPTLTEINKIDVTDISQTQSGIIGQFYTVSRKNPPSSITKENQTVYNGDSTSLLIGSLYKADKITLTETWHRVGKVESEPILLISAKDDLRIQCNAIKVFSGSVYGQLPYLSVININNIIGLFMFTEYSYDIMSRKVSGKLTQFYNNDLGDIESLISPDYGNTVKPTIKG